MFFGTSFWIPRHEIIQNWSVKSSHIWYVDCHLERQQISLLHVRFRSNKAACCRTMDSTKYSMFTTPLIPVKILNRFFMDAHKSSVPDVVADIPNQCPLFFHLTDITLRAIDYRRSASTPVMGHWSWAEINTRTGRFRSLFCRASGAVLSDRVPNRMHRSTAWKASLHYTLGN